jgi:hypothetical protein
MAEKKITKRMVVEMMLKEEFINSNADYKSYLENELALLNKKADNRKATKTQVENVGIKDHIVTVLNTIGKGRAGEVQSALQNSFAEDCGTISNQRVSAILNQMVADKLCTKTTEKGISIFSLA